MSRMILTVSFLFLLPLASFAQDDFLKMRKSPLFQKSMELEIKSSIRSFWDGQGANMLLASLLDDPYMENAGEETLGKIFW